MGGFVKFNKLYCNTCNILLAVQFPHQKTLIILHTCKEKDFENYCNRCNTKLNLQEANHANMNQTIRTSTANKVYAESKR